MSHSGSLKLSLTHISISNYHKQSTPPLLFDQKALNQLHAILSVIQEGQSDCRLLLYFCTVENMPFVPQAHPITSESFPNASKENGYCDILHTRHYVKDRQRWLHNYHECREICEFLADIRQMSIPSLQMRISVPCIWCYMLLSEFLYICYVSLVDPTYTLAHLQLLVNLIL